MFHDAIAGQPVQDDRPLAAHLRARLTQFVRPVMTRLAQQIDIRLVQTARDLVQVILTHRHRAMGLLLSELGSYLLGPAQAPAGTKRISNLVHAVNWSADDINAVLWKEATDRVQTLKEEGDEVLAVWDGSVWEKPESQAGEDWCPVRSAKARRLARRRKGISLPLKGPPILVPGLHWDGIAVLGMQGAPTLAHMEWWTTRGPHATTQRDVEQRLLDRCALAWGQSVRHVWDRGYAGSPWVQAAITATVRFVVRWKKGNKLLDNWGEARKAWEIARGKRSIEYRMLRDPRTKQLIKVGVVVIPVTLVGHPQPLWLVVARLGGGREPWYLLTNDPIHTLADAWAVVLSYARRWQIEEIWRASKSELAFESPRVEDFSVRQKLLLVASLAYAFLLYLLDPSLDAMRAQLLRNWCHRTGTRYRTVAAPLYRLRAALSRLWQAAPPPGYHQPVLNSG
jgi:Transposase DDE domain